MCEGTKQDIAKKEALFWEMVKTLNMLLVRIEAIGDKFQNLYDRAEHERQQARAAVFEKYLKKRLELKLETKKGAIKNGINSEGRPKATNP
jgi:hypothetical protein